MISNFISGNYFNKKKENTSMVDYGFIDAPPNKQPSSKSNGIQSKENLGNHNSNNGINNHSRAGKNISNIFGVNLDRLIQNTKVA